MRWIITLFALVLIVAWMQLRPARPPRKADSPQYGRQHAVFDPISGDIVGIADNRSSR